MRSIRSLLSAICWPIVIVAWMLFNDPIALLGALALLSLPVFIGIVIGKIF